MGPYLRVATLDGFLTVARQAGLDGARLMRAHHLDPADLAVPDRWIRAVSAARLLEAAAEESDQDDFGLRLAEQRRLSTLGPLSVVLREEPDLRRVLMLLTRYERSYNEALHVRMEEGPDLTAVRVWVEFGEPVPARQGLCLAVAALHGIIAECLPAGWEPLAVCFTREAPADLTLYHRAFGPRLRFGHDFDGLLIYTRDLGTDNVLADPLLRPYARQYLESIVSPRATTSTQRVREVVEVLLPLGKCSVDRAARSLGVDRRTLQRHLALEGESFSGIVHDARAGMAERNLANPGSSMTEVSQLLGFASPSAFSRWFHQQFGLSPSQWRERAMVPAEPALAGTAS
ncbi:AraC family transcriptional regulator [Nocardioides insulae]|uniref:AraC family transcriptional regulator n=1 Tax=Nocardioides insulae TaxID=394734 RepID=UPI00056461C3|nr:AraC family transcriptional regulator [Nocardioides insulae]